MLPLVVLIAGMFMSVLDTSIVNVAIPTIQNDFGVNTDDAQWVVTAYALALGVVVPCTAWLGERFGMTRVYNIALLTFAGTHKCQDHVRRAVGRLIPFPGVRSAESWSASSTPDSVPGITKLTPYLRSADAVAPDVRPVVALAEWPTHFPYMEPYISALARRWRAHGLDVYPCHLGQLKRRGAIYG